MAKLNTKPKTEPIYTHGGAKATRTSVMNQLRRSVLSCFLWENEFYEDGQKISDRIIELAKQVSASDLAELAIETRNANLRHVPLLLLTVLCETGSGSSLVSDTIEKVIQRADEISELVAIYWRNGKRPLSAQLKKGLAKAFRKFDAYQLGKYNRDGAIKLRDVLFLVHARPNTQEAARLYKALADKTLESPDTWEVALSGGANKKETFERLIREGKLGYFALIRNLRGMTDAGVDRNLIREAILARKNGADKILPFRFITAARHAPQFESELDKAFVASFDKLPKLPGRTVVVIDISGSMGQSMSVKSELNRMDAACALGALLRHSCDDVAIYATAGNDYSRTHATGLVPSRNGMALMEAIVNQRATLGSGGIFLNQVCKFLSEKEKGVDRMIVITDEQDCSSGDKDKPALANPLGTSFNYMLNVASAKNGIGYGKWTHIDGFSENVVRFIHQYEASGNLN